MLVAVAVAGIYTDASGVPLTAKTITLTPTAVFGDAGLLVPTQTVTITTNASTGAYSTNLYTSDVAGAYVRYRVVLHNNKKKYFDLTDDDLTVSLDQLFNLFDASTTPATPALSLELLSLAGRISTLEGSIGGSYQPLDADLTAIAALATQAYGRGLLVIPNASDLRTNAGLIIGTNVQAFDAELTQIAALADPNADRVLFWDDSAGTYTYLTMGTGLTITGTTLDAAVGGMAIGGTITGSPTVGSVLFVGAAGVLAQDNTGIFYDDTNNQLKMTASAAAQVPFLIKLAASHSGNPFEINSSAGSAGDIFKIDKDGSVFVGTSLAIIKTAGTMQFRSPADFYLTGGGSSNSIYVQADSATNLCRFHAGSAGETRFSVYDETAGSFRRVSIGAADSGGTGFRYLRIPN